MIDVSLIKKDFPILERQVRDGKPLVYLDSGATSQKPRCVLDAEREYYEMHNASVHRGAHQLAEEATQAYEDAREAIAGFVGSSANEIVFTKNASESLNLLAYAFTNASALACRGHAVDPRFVVGPDDSIVVTEMEHHANLVPWQEVCAKTGAQLRWIPITDDGRLDLTSVDRIIDRSTKVVSVVHQSNILGTINPVRLLMDRAHEVGALGIIDACQSIPHMPVDVAELGADAVACLGCNLGCRLSSFRIRFLDSNPSQIWSGLKLSAIGWNVSLWRQQATPVAFSKAVSVEAVVRGCVAKRLRMAGERFPECQLWPY
jgi:cysteine desulfurase/selenocysteine lyase